MFFLDPCQYEARITVVITLLLTQVSLHTNVRQALPDVPYNTRLDAYISVCYFLLYLNTVIISLFNYGYETLDCCTGEGRAEKGPCEYEATGIMYSLREVEFVVVGVLALLWLAFNCMQGVQIRWHMHNESGIYIKFW